MGLRVACSESSVILNPEELVAHVSRGGGGVDAVHTAGVAVELIGRIIDKWAVQLWWVRSALRQETVSLNQLLPTDRTVKYLEIILLREI